MIGGRAGKPKARVSVSFPMPSIAQLERLLQADPNDAFVLYGLAQEHAKTGDVTKAVEFYDRCLGADPKYCYAYYHKAKTLADADRTAEAVHVARHGIEAAKSCNDDHALSELSALLDQLE